MTYITPQYKYVRKRPNSDSLCFVYLRLEEHPWYMETNDFIGSFSVQLGRHPCTIVLLCSSIPRHLHIWVINLLRCGDPASYEVTRLLNLNTALTCRDYEFDDMICDLRMNMIRGSIVVFKTCRLHASQPNLSFRSDLKNGCYWRNQGKRHMQVYKSWFWHTVWQCMLW